MSVLKNQRKLNRTLVKLDGLIEVASKILLEYKKIDNGFNNPKIEKKREMLIDKFTDTEDDAIGAIARLIKLIIFFKDTYSGEVIGSQLPSKGVNTFVTEEVIRDSLREYVSVEFDDMTDSIKLTTKESKEEFFIDISPMDLFSLTNYSPRATHSYIYATHDIGEKIMDQLATANLFNTSAVKLVLEKLKRLNGNDEFPLQIDNDVIEQIDVVINNIG